MAKFWALRNKDAGDAFIHALVQAGHTLVDKLEQADFALIDHEHAGGLRDRIAAFLQNHPVFVYPHTPLSYFIWDEHYKPLPVSCNFVAGEGAKKSLEAYGYPNRTETIGFTRCEVLPFSPTFETRLLFVPARTRGNGQYANDAYGEMTPKAFRFILDNLRQFESVTVCYVNDFVNESDYLTSGIRFVKTDPQKSPNPTDDMLYYIDWADIIISCETVGCLSVARGKPTVFYNAKATPSTSNIPAGNYEKYRQYYEFPLTLEDLSIQNVLDVRKFQNSAVELWKRNNIGESFNKDKFLRIVGEYVS